MTAIVGFAALTVDIGVMYNAKADLQRNVDSAALAAAARLIAFDEGDPMNLARQEALKFAAQNRVFGRTIILDSADIEFGRAVYSEYSGAYDFVPTTVLPDAVRVRARLEHGSTNGALSLYFARVFGKDYAEMSAEAIAMVVPRDISVVADLSGSQNDDSELRNFKRTQINLFDVWSALPIEKGNNGVGNGVDPPPPGNPNSVNDPIWAFPGSPGNAGGNQDPGADPLTGGQVGPTWGLMYYWGNLVTTDYDPTTDPGLYYRPKGQNWNDAALAAWFQYVGYSQEETLALMSSTYDLDGAWPCRTAVALGLARWDSGISGGLWDGLPPGHTNRGNGDSLVGGNELVWLGEYPFDSGSWIDFIEYTDRGSQMTNADPNFRHRLGLKTFVNYLLEQQPGNAQTPELADTPAQPMQAVKDATAQLSSLLSEWGTNDHLSLEVYGATARHEVDLTNDFEVVANRISAMQAGHYDTWTNMGGGILCATEELTGARARRTARKVMILLTDGGANVTADGTVGDSYAATVYAKEMARSAAGQNIVIFSVSVGSGADQVLMQEIAAMGSGEHFHAEGSIEVYSAELEQIFKALGGKRAVELIR